MHSYRAAFSPTAAIALFALCAPAGAANFTADDLVRLERISEPAASPDGRYVTYTVRETDIEADRGRTDLWLMDIDAPKTAPRPLTTHRENDSSAAWSHDGGHVYFLSTRSGSSQVWRIAANGGEAQVVTQLPVDVNNFALSADGSHLAVSLDVYPDCADLVCTVNRLRDQTDQKTRGMLFDRLFVRHWDAWDDGRQSHLFVLPMQNGIALGTPIDVSATLDADVPSKPFGDASEYNFAPDSKSIVFTARIKGKTEAWSTNFDLYEVSVAGGAARNLTADNAAWDTQPLFSADGAWLAWRAMQRPGFEADRFRVVLLNRKTGERRVLTDAWDRSIDAIAFARDGKSLYATTDHLGQHPLWSLDLKTGKPTQLTTLGHVDSFSVGKSEVIYALAHLQSPAELFAVKTTGAIRQLTHLNATTLAGKSLVAPEQFNFVGANNETVYAHIVKPANFDANKKYPLAFFVHGGPQVSYGNAWSFRWNPQTYAGAGYAFIAIDFHGSPGYGQKFTDSISGDWGGKPLVDLQKGLAAALQKYPWLDADRICALGASYGGYMMNWIAGTWPEPFKCIVNHAGIFDNRFMMYSTEELWFDEWEHGGAHFQVPENYERQNPVTHVAKWRVPMLVIAGQKDYRVPYSQSIAAFTALQRRGIPSRLLLYPSENHWVLKPSNSLQWHREVERWLKEHLH
ncbi:MAG: S9 family peptidase [Candidatus Obscuribacterales bacterium]|nr:S9 family peptidase [Steroidobacteraceae bacterium]